MRGAFTFYHSGLLLFTGNSQENYQQLQLFGILSGIFTSAFSLVAVTALVRHMFLLSRRMSNNREPAPRRITASREHVCPGDTLSFRYKGSKVCKGENRER